MPTSTWTLPNTPDRRAFVRPRPSNQASNRRRSAQKDSRRWPTEMVHEAQASVGGVPPTQSGGGGGSGGEGPSGPSKASRGTRCRHKGQINRSGISGQYSRACLLNKSNNLSLMTRALSATVAPPCPVPRLLLLLLTLADPSRFVECS